jgi:hypothetical protein
MVCTNTALMVGGGLLAGYGVLQIKGEKKPFSKLEIIGPIAAGLALLGYGFMNKGSCGQKKQPQPELPGIKESLEKRQSTNTAPPITLSRSSNAISSDARVWSNYTVNQFSSGNASPQYDYNHVYPGFI